MDQVAQVKAVQVADLARVVMDKVARVVGSKAGIPLKAQTHEALQDLLRDVGHDAFRI